MKPTVHTPLRVAASLAAPLLVGALSACAIVSPGGTSTYIGYSTRVVETYTILNLDKREFRLKETQVYGSTGKLGGRFVQVYAGGLNTEINIYAVDEQGTSTLSEHQVITYTTKTNSAGNPEQVVALNESFDSDNVRRSYFEVTYHASLQTSYALWQLRTRKDDGTDVVQDERKATYYTTGAGVDSDWVGKLRTEQFYSYDANGANKKLTKESAFWYDADGRLLSQLDHVIRGTDVSTDAVLPAGVDDRYLYSSYSRNAQDYIFSRIQYLYEAPTASPIPKQADLSFTVTDANPDPFAYNINADAVKYQVGMEISDYDGLGNLVQETVYSFGTRQEVRTYAYLEPGFETERARYVNGGTVLDQKVVTRYRVEKIGGTDHWIKETFTYNTDDAIELDQD
jgi:hypothetical protein